MCFVSIAIFGITTNYFLAFEVNCVCFKASLDDPTQTVVMHRSEPSRLQSLALQLADKVNNLVESNERIFEMKQGITKKPFITKK